MNKFLLIYGLLCTVAFPLCAQNWTPQDSLRLQQLLKGDGEVKVNPNALKELQMNLLGAPKASTDRPWMEFDTSLPKEPKRPGRLTLRPYTARTKYNWDPVYQKKIKVEKDTWRGDPFYAFKKAPVFNGYSGGHDLMLVFTREFWDFKGKKRRARTLKELKMYGDSVTVRMKREEETEVRE